MIRERTGRHLPPRPTPDRRRSVGRLIARPLAAGHVSDDSVLPHLTPAVHGGSQPPTGRLAGYLVGAFKEPGSIAVDCPSRDFGRTDGRKVPIGYPNVTRIRVRTGIPVGCHFRTPTSTKSVRRNPGAPGSRQRRMIGFEVMQESAYVSLHLTGDPESVNQTGPAGNPPRQDTNRPGSSSAAVYWEASPHFIPQSTIAAGWTDHAAIFPEPSGLPPSASD